MSDGERKLVIYGTGEMARVAHWYFERDSPYRVVGFTVDREYLDEESFLDCPVVAFDEVTGRFPPGSTDAFVAMSYAEMNQVRSRKCAAARGAGYRLASYVSSRCSYLAETPPGDNAFILEDNTIQPFVEIGANVWLWSGNHIGHGTVIEDDVYIASHVVVSGFCTIGHHSFIGVNACLRESLKVAPFTLIGAGATIMKDTEPYGVYVPPRAVKLDRRSDEVPL